MVHAKKRYPSREIDGTRRDGFQYLLLNNLPDIATAFRRLLIVASIRVIYYPDDVAHSQLASLAEPSDTSLRKNFRCVTHGDECMLVGASAIHSCTHWQERYHRAG
jgi:hypothetical protein